MADQNTVDSTNILRLARELGQVYEEVLIYDEYAVDDRLSKEYQDRCDQNKCARDKRVQDLETAIMLTRAECLDDVVCQCAVAVIGAVTVEDYAEPDGQRYAAQMRAALTSMALVLMRDHGDAYIERLGREYCGHSLLLGSRSRKGEVRPIMEQTIAMWRQMETARPSLVETI